jgi:ABC-type dipeptide/oligopeptide/nickel transport system permease component
MLVYIPRRILYTFPTLIVISIVSFVLIQLPPGDFPAHLRAPVFVLGAAGVAKPTRIMRANLLAEVNKPHVETARAKGLPEFRLLLKHPQRVSLNPFISTIGWVLPALVSGSVAVAVVLALPLSGPPIRWSSVSRSPSSCRSSAGRTWRASCASGCGRSTASRRILRGYDPTAGAMTCRPAAGVDDND